MIHVICGSSHLMTLIWSQVKDLPLLTNTFSRTSYKMEAKLNTIEAMFAKTEADLNYAMRRLDDENARADEDDQVGA